jgi:hypothetical protein
MKFQEYQESRTESKDLSQDLGFWAGLDQKQPGFIYLGCDYVMSYAGGVYSVLLGNMEHLTRSLDEAEEVLWANHHVGEHKVMLEGNDLDVFVRGYCALRHYRVDGDVFGMAFHDADDHRYHPGRAREIIEEYVKIYDLYRVEEA